MADKNVRMWDIWRPFKAEDYRYAWNSNNILGVFRQLLDDLKYSFQRVRYGYCERDLWSIDAWFLDVMPRMLEEYRDTRHGSPLINENDRDNDEVIKKTWDEIVNRMIFLFREASEDTCTMINPYEDEIHSARDDFTKRFGFFGEKLMTDEEKENAEKTRLHAWHSVSELPEYKEMCDKYFEEDRKIAEYRVKCKDEAFELFTKYFYDLWD